MWTFNSLFSVSVAMTLSKYIKNTSIGIVALIFGFEFYNHCSVWLKKKLQVDEDLSTLGDINMVVYTRSEENYKNRRLTRNISFVREPVEHATEVIVNLIMSAQDSIYVAMYIFTSDPLARALMSARNKGIDVKCVVDASMETASCSKVRLLHKAGIPVKIHDAKTLHLKLCVIDVPYGKKKKSVREQNSKTFMEGSCPIPGNGIVITGSLNWTREALMSNEENFIVSSNADMCQSSAKKFHEIWNDSRLY